MRLDPELILSKIKKPIYLEKITLIILNIIPEYYYLHWSTSVGDQYIRILLLTISILWLYGIIMKKIYYAGLAYTLTSIALIAYSYDVKTVFTTCFISSIWLMFSSTLVSYFFEKGYGFKRTISIKGVLLTIIIFLIVYGVYIYVGYYLANLVYNTYSYIISVTPELFQKFYEVFITTRIGSIVLLVLFVFIVYYVLNTYITLLISDTIALNKEFALKRIITTLRSEARKIVYGKDPFQRLFASSFLYVIMFYLYGVTYPLYSNFYRIVHEYLSRFSLPEYMVLIIWFAILYLVSYIVYKILYSRIISVIKPSILKTKHDLRKILRITVWKPFYIFLFLTVYYATFIALVAPNEFLGILTRAFGLNVSGNVFYNNPFLQFMTKQYIHYTYYLSQYLQNYILRMEEAYRLLTKLVKDIIEFIWG